MYSIRSIPALYVGYTTVYANKTSGTTTRLFLITHTHSNCLFTSCQSINTISTLSTRLTLSCLSWALDPTIINVMSPKLHFVKSIEIYLNCWLRVHSFWQSSQSVRPLVAGSLVCVLTHRHTPTHIVCSCLIGHETRTFTNKRKSLKKKYFSSHIFHYHSLLHSHLYFSHLCHTRLASYLSHVFLLHSVCLPDLLSLLGRQSVPALLLSFLLHCLLRKGVCHRPLQIFPVGQTASRTETAVLLATRWYTQIKRSWALIPTQPLLKASAATSNLYVNQT